MLPGALHRTSAALGLRRTPVAPAAYQTPGPALHKQLSAGPFLYMQALLIRGLPDNLGQCCMLGCLACPGVRLSHALLYSAQHAAAHTSHIGNAPMRARHQVPLLTALRVIRPRDTACIQSCTAHKGLWLVDNHPQLMARLVLVIHVVLRQRARAVHAPPAVHEAQHWQLSAQRLAVRQEQSRGRRVRVNSKPDLGSGKPYQDTAGC